MKKGNWLIVFGAALAVGCGADRTIRVEDLRCENLSSPTAVDELRPRFSWKIAAEGPFRQAAYEIRVATDSLALLSGAADLWNPGEVADSSSVGIPYGGRALESPSLAYWKVRVRDREGRLSAWSPIARFGIGLLDPSAWPETYIGMTGCTSPLLRRRVSGLDPRRTHLLHVNSLGYHEVYVNGAKVSDEVLAPAVSQLDKRSLAVTYDVTPYLREGDNELVLWLGRGWYRKGLFGTEHDGPLVRVRLDEMAGGTCTTRLESDASWSACESGYDDTQTTTWFPLRFGGECVDGRRVFADLRPETLDGAVWTPVSVVRVADRAVSPRMCEPNRLGEAVAPVSLRQEADDVWVADMGRTLTGWIELGMPPLEAGSRVTIEYSDWLDDDGTFARPEGEAAFGRDVYIARGGGNEVFRNRFNHHAFRYLRISGLPARPERLAARPIRGAFGDAAEFECSDADLNAIYGMVKHTLGNLALGGYVVDCPHLERMGYGGDGNASCRTFQTLYDAAPLYANWMRMWADCIREDGGMPHNVPNPYPAGGGPYWCGFIITASWQSWINYGDDRSLQRYYPQMKRWLEYVDRYTVDGLLRRWPDTDYRGWYLGDWLAPAGVDFTAPESIDLVSNCFVCDCLATMAKIAAHLGEAEQVAAYDARCRALRQRIHDTFFDPATARYATGSQIDQAYPMLVGAADAEAEAVAARLFADTETRLGGHIGAGLVGVTILTDWAIDAGCADFVYGMLKRREAPGYLYMIDRGATTTWESWDGERSKIHNCYNGIGAWFIQALGGIRPDEEEPGYRHILFRPQIPEGVTWARAAKETPYGTVSIAWRTEENRVTAELRIPANARGTFVLPAGTTECDVDGTRMSAADGRVAMESGRHRIAYEK